jgi:hypothetical protein
MSRIWEEGNTMSPELYVKPAKAIKKQSRFEKSMRKAVKKDTEMVRQAHASEQLPDSCSS